MSYIIRILLTAGLLTLSANSVQALEFVVNATVDRPDINPGNGSCNPEGLLPPACSLRAAIMEANAHPGEHVITLFDGGAKYLITRDGDEFEDQALTGDLDIHGHITILRFDETRPMISGGFIDRVFDIMPGATLIIDNVDVGGGRAVKGGAFWVRGTLQDAGTLGIQNSSISLNIGEDGGAISNDGLLVLNSVEFFNNAITDEIIGPLARGAVINNGGEAFINNSTFRNNGVIPGGGIDLVPDAHVIWTTPNLVDQPRLVITNSSFFDNSNGIFSDAMPTGLLHVTMARNGPLGLELLADNNLGELQYQINHSVIYGHDQDCNDLPNDNIAFDVEANFNASSDASCGFGNIDAYENIENPFTSDPAPFGGLTTVLMPDYHSVLIDPVSGLCVNGMPTDQRAFPRPIDGDDDGIATCDIGAVEYNPEFDPNDLFVDGFEG
jgi:CSLREA domain-containing protein